MQRCKEFIVMTQKYFMIFFRTVIASVAFLAVSCLSFPGFGSGTDTGKGTAPPSVRELQTTFRGIADTIIPVVVSINVTDITGGENPWEYFFQDPEEDQGGPGDRDFERSGMGSGVIVKKKENVYYILTNFHVVKGGNEINVVLSDYREYEARVVGTDERRDMALVSIETGDELPVAQLGDSDTLRVGDWVIAVGSPYGWESTVTSGIVSALGRRLSRNASISNINDFIQTDAGINPGNSGGALVNLDGEIVGINTWITSPTGGSIGIGFAIPINNAKKLVDDFITIGKVQYGWLGVSINRSITRDVEKELEIDRKKGAFVNFVIKGSPAEKGGILPGDFIMKVNGKQVLDEGHFIQMIGNIPPDAPVVFTLLRAGKEVTLTFAIELRPAEATVEKMSNNSWPGFIAISLSDATKKRFELAPKETGVVVISVERDTPAFHSGMHSGDVIKKINAAVITNMVEYYAALNDLSKKELIFEVLRGGSTETITLTR
ncbi:MAG: Do family serine endopeptidase [Spirochaetales bacterium]|nr:Do family serine endopeptidase [Spirochaetales bacterium]